MSSCLSGGGGSRPYGFDLEIVKSSRLSPPRSNSHNTSSPASTISESSNSSLSISTRKPRTPRKRPNQTYNEAAALLSSMYPTIFPTSRHQKFTKFPIEFFSDESESSDLFVPFRETRSFDRTRFQLETKMTNFVRVQSKMTDLSVADEFYAESILDEETEGGIDSIMGSNGESVDQSDNRMKFGLNWKLRFGIGGGRGSIKPWKRAEEMNYWWNFPTVDVLEISPKLRPITEPIDKKKVIKKKTKGKKKTEKMKSSSEVRNPGPPKEELSPIQTNVAAEKSKLQLKLNYDGVLDAWSGNSPFSDERPNAGTVAATSGDVYLRF